LTWFDDALADGRLEASKVSMIDLALPLLWRVYPEKYGVHGFNRTPLGNARFSPFNVGGAIVPALYAGGTLDVALMETVWHDAPVPSNGFHLVLQESMERRRVGSLKPSGPLRLVDLTTVGLRRLGLTRSDVIDSSELDYPITRQLGAWLYENKPDAQGICWISRQSDEGRAVVLFEPRLGSVKLVPNTKDEIFTDGPHLDAVLTLAERMGATVIVR
jgi:hypothetical protein